MENLRSDFIVDHKPGEWVTIRLGDNGEQWSGRIIDWNERRLRLEVEGYPRSILFSAITAYYQTQQASQPSILPVQAETPAEQAVRRVADAQCRLTPLDMADLSEQIRLAPNTVEKERVSNLCYHFKQYLSTIPRDPQTLKRLLASADTLSGQYTSSDLVQRLAGEIAQAAQSWGQAEENFNAAGLYGRAFAAAQQAADIELQQDDGACHLLYEKKLQAPVVYNYVRLMEKEHDLSVFYRFLETRGEEYAQLAADCLCWLLAQQQLPLPEGAAISESTVISAMAELVEKAYPVPMDNQMYQLEREDEEETEPTPPSEPREETPVVQPAEEPEQDVEGYIHGYNYLRKIGRICSKSKPDWFFHLNHITDPSLRLMMEQDPQRRYLVHFDVGSNMQGPCAVNIRLRDPDHPFEEDLTLDEEHTGQIVQFYPDFMNGHIAEGEKIYQFRVDEISDQVLQNYCRIFSDVVQRKFPLIFRLKNLAGGKQVAVDIRKAEPFSPSEEQLIAREMEQEKNRQGVMTAYYFSQRQGQISGGSMTYQFTLDDITDPVLHDLCATTKNVAARRPRVVFSVAWRRNIAWAENIRRFDVAPEEHTVSLPSEPQLVEEEKPAISANPFLNLPPWPVHQFSDDLYVRAQEEKLHGDLDRAVELYLDAIRAGCRLESSVGDLVGLFLQMNQNEKAIQLMEAFEKVLPADKALNNWITIYDRTKSNDPRLHQLYEQVLRGNLKLNTRFHYLIKLAQLETRMGDYPTAMETYRKWEELAVQAERGIMGSHGWEKATLSPGQKQVVKRGRAICLYHMGQVERAKTMASELVAIKPDDAAALAILDDPLTPAGTAPAEQG